MELLSCEALLIEPSGITIEAELSYRITPTRVLSAPISKLETILLTKSFIATKLLLPILPEASNTKTMSRPKSQPMYIYI